MNITDNINNIRIKRLYENGQNQKEKKSNSAGIRFDTVLQNKLNEKKFNENVTIINNAEKNEITFSKHAQERLKVRGINLTDEFMESINGAVAKAADKGIKNALLMSDDSALIVNIGSKTVITAMNINEMRENIITNIDGTVMI